MRAIEITRFGAPEVLRSSPSGPTRAGAGRGADRASARRASTGPTCCSARALYPPPPGASDLPGLEVAGDDRRRRRRRAGRGGLRARRPGLRAGRRRRLCASCASRRSASACRCRKGLSDVEAASLPETFFTVWQNVFDTRAPAARRDAAGAGRHRAASASPRSSCKALGATVIATAGSDDKCAACLALGADHAINYKDAGLRRRGQARSPTAAASTSCSTWSPATTWRASSSAWPTTAASRSSRCRAARRARSTPARVLRKRLTITGSTLRPRPVAFKAAHRARRCASSVWPLLEAGRDQAGDPPGVPGRAGRAGACADGVGHARRQDRADLVA